MLCVPRLAIAINNTQLGRLYIQGTRQSSAGIQDPNFSMATAQGQHAQIKKRNSGS